jgi:hypothetical protein
LKEPILPCAEHAALVEKANGIGVQALGDVLSYFLDGGEYEIRTKPKESPDTAISDFCSASRYSVQYPANLNYRKMAAKTGVWLLCLVHANEAPLFPGDLPGARLA